MPTPAGIRLRNRILSVVSVAFAALLVSWCPANAAGNHGLNARIIHNPFPAWPLSQANSSATAIDLQRQMSAPSLKIVTADKEWDSTDQNSFLNVGLIAYLNLSRPAQTELRRTLPDDAKSRAPKLFEAPPNLFNRCHQSVKGSLRSAARHLSLRSPLMW